MSDTPQHPHSQQILQKMRSPMQVSFATGMPDSLPVRRDSRMTMRRHLPRFVAVPPVLAPNWGLDITSPQSLFAPPLPQTAAELAVGNANLSIGGATVGTPADNNDTSFPFRAALGGIAVPLRRMCSTSEGAEPTATSGRFERDDTEEHGRLLEEYRTRFLHRHRQTRGNSINVSTDGMSSVGGRDAYSLDGASSMKAPATGDLAMFQAMTSAAVSTRSLAGCASLPESLGGPQVENDEDAQNVTTGSIMAQPLFASKRSIDSSPDDESSDSSLTLAVTHCPVAARSGLTAHARRFSAASEARTRKAGTLDVVQVRLSSLRHLQEHDQSMPLPQEAQNPRANYSHTQRDLGHSNSYTFGVDDQASGSSW